MKKLIAILILAIGSLSCSAQNNTQPTPNVTYETSPNLIPSAAGTWSNTVPASNNGYSGGSSAGFNSGTNTILFGYTQQTVAYNYAFSLALQNAGLAIGGYNYSWKINNNDVPTVNIGTLVGKFTLKALNGTALQTYTYDYSNVRTVGDSENFQTFSGTQWFPQNYASSQISAFSMEWTGKDNRYWAGYYGPRVREPSIQLRYLVDACAANPLSSPDCPGYAEAYKTQQCTANPLYDATCPGYAIAYHDQQCTANPLYMSDCPGYNAAYKSQQCTLNPLYATDCPGYETAYKSQQCSLNALYDTTCEGYAAAYKSQQCNLSALYATDCPGYAAAYKSQQCSLNALYATDCPGYATAYFNQQCLKDSLYDKKCEGYATAYAIKYLTPSLDPATTAAVNSQLTTNVETVKNDPAKVTVVSSTVDSVLSAPSITSATSVSPASVTSVLMQSAPTAASPTANATTTASAPPPPPPAAKQEEKQQEQKKTDGEVKQAERKAGGNAQNAKKEVAAKAAEIAKNAGKAATLEAQTAQQGLLVGLMGYVPGFNGYQQANLPDTNGLEMAKQYAKPVVDNRSAQRRLSASSESRWQEIVDSQYRN